MTSCAWASVSIGAVLVGLGLTFLIERQRPLETWGGIGDALDESSRSLTDFLEERAKMVPPPDGERFGEAWWMFHHGDADHQAETLALFSTRFRREFEELLGHAVKQRYRPAAQDLDTLRSVASVEKLWEFSVVALGSSEELHHGAEGSLSRLTRVSWAKALIDAAVQSLPPDGPPPSWLADAFPGIRERVRVALIQHWNPRIPEVEAEIFTEFAQARLDNAPDQRAWLHELQEWVETTMRRLAD